MKKIASKVFGSVFSQEEPEIPEQVPQLRILHRYTLFHPNENVIPPRRPRYLLAPELLPDSSIIQQSSDPQTMYSEGGLPQFSLLSPSFCKPLCEHLCANFHPSLIANRLELSRHGFNHMKTRIGQEINNRIQHGHISLSKMLPYLKSGARSFVPYNIYLRGSEDKLAFDLQDEIKKSMRTVEHRNLHNLEIPNIVFYAMININMPGQNYKISIRSQIEEGNIIDGHAIYQQVGSCILFPTRSFIVGSYESLSSPQLEEGMLNLLVGFTEDQDNEESFPFLRLPTELQLQIISFLGPWDFTQVKRVSKSMKSLTENKMFTAKLLNFAVPKALHHLHAIQQELTETQATFMEMNTWYLEITREIDESISLSSAHKKILRIALESQELICNIGRVILEDSRRMMLKQKAMGSVLLPTFRNLEFVEYKYYNDYYAGEQISHPIVQTYFNSISKLPSYKAHKERWPNYWTFMTHFPHSRYARFGLLLKETRQRMAILNLECDYEEEIALMNWEVDLLNSIGGHNLGRMQTPDGCYAFWDSQGLLSLMKQIVPRETLCCQTKVQKCLLWKPIKNTTKTKSKKTEEMRESHVVICGQFFMVIKEKGLNSREGRSLKDIYLISDIEFIISFPPQSLS